MPRELLRMVVAAPAPAMAPTTPVAVVVSFKSLLKLVRKHELEIKVITAWVVWFVLRYLQALLGPMRRRSRHWLVQYGAMAAYYLPTLIVFYTANAVYSSDSDIKVVLSIGCSVLLISCARGSVTMTAFTLGDGPLRLKSWRLLPWLLYFAWLQWGLIWWDRKLTTQDVYYFLVLCVGPLLYVLIVKHGVAILDYETKVFADYMVHESRSSSLTPFFDGGANGLQGRCKYPFMQLKEGRWITFRDVQRLRVRRQLTGDDRAVDPDSCLSYSFCRLLARRYFGFPCPEDGKAQVRDFVLTELLADCNRAFTVVEVQLALLHDYFFTNYHSNVTSGMLSAKQAVAKLLWETLIFMTSYAVGFVWSGGLSGGVSAVVYRVCASAVPTVLIYTVILQPQYPVLPTYWHPIQHLILYYLTNTAATQDTSRPSGSPVTNRSDESSRRSCYWRNKIGQYSVMEDYDRRSYRKAFIAWCKVHVLSQVPYSFITHHPTEEEDVDVSNSLRSFLARATKEMNGPPTMGTRSLGVYSRGNGSLDDLSWFCNQQETLTHTILTWHVATCYCDMMSQPLEEEVPQPLQQGSMSIWSLEEPSTGYRKVATTLSKYCAYLVAFLPDLLPEHSLTVKVVFQRVLQATRDLLGTTRMSMEEKRRKIRQLHLPEEVSSGVTTFQWGVWIGRQLEQRLDVSLRWKVLADFWAEMILYAASSDNAAAHIEQLAQGGEFVTHLWALLCNAGILKPATEEGTPQQHPEAIPSQPNMATEERPSIIFPRRTVSATA